MNNKKTALLALTVVVALMTLFVRIPLPTRGYFNVGDVAVVFAGLVLGSLSRERRFGWGAAAGGIGSALADIIGGYAIFAPVTLIAKGLERKGGRRAAEPEGFIVEGREGQYRVRLADNRHGWDCAYPGLELLPDGTFVATTYGHWSEGEEPYILSVRFTLEELDALAADLAR